MVVNLSMCAKILLKYFIHFLLSVIFAVGVDLCWSVYMCVSVYVSLLSLKLQDECDAVGTDWVWNWSSRPEAVPPRSVFLPCHCM